MIRATRTYALLDVSKATFDEIHRRLSDVGHLDLPASHDGEPVIDMHGLALRIERQEFAPGQTVWYRLHDHVWLTCSVVSVTAKRVCVRPTDCRSHRNVARQNVSATRPNEGEVRG